jgi:hypothetical protein
MVGSKGSIKFSIKLGRFKKFQISRIDGPAVVLPEEAHEDSPRTYRSDDAMRWSGPICPMDRVAADVGLLGNYHDGSPGSLLIY